MNTATKARIVVILLFSCISFLRSGSIRLSVSVEEEVRTREESVDIEAERTRMSTMAISISGSFESIEGMMLSKPFAATCSLVAKSLPKPPRK